MARRHPVGAADAGAPRYAVLARDLLRGIGEGSYPVGSLLPTEAELCRRYAVSRITARAALRELQARGLVSRRAGVGTRVEQATAEERFVHVSDSVEALLQFTEDTRFRLVSQRALVADAPLAAALQCAEGRELVEAVGLRERAQGTALCLARLYFPADLGGVVARLDGHRGSVMLLLERLFGVRLAEMRQVIEAAPLRAADARLLAARPREAALVTRRWHLGDGARLLIASVSLYPHRRYSYELRMRRQHADITTMNGNAT
ncbi:MAG: GntR family transcriptional regulator [Burkholderiales bacterium]|nr:GntR family transcriptional regulator [Burkholderiales bacterium]